MTRRASFEEDYSNPIFVKNVIQRTIEGLEALVARGDKMLKKEPPTLPAGEYPRRIKSLDFWAPGAPVPKAYLLSKGRSAITHEILRRINPTEEHLSHDYRLSNAPGKVVKQGLEKITLVNFFFDKILKKHHQSVYASIYPVSVELAEKTHLFDCRCAGAELIMTPKENLLAAEAGGWYKDIMEFAGSVYGVAQQHIEMAHDFGWKIDRLGYPESGEGPIMLDVYVALDNLRKIRAQYNEDIFKVGSQRFRAKTSSTTRTKPVGREFAMDSNLSR